MAIKVTQKLASNNTLLQALAKYDVSQLQLLDVFEATTMHFVPVSLFHDTVNSRRFSSWPISVGTVPEKHGGRLETTTVGIG